jgi:hypothetical protein
MTHKLVDARSVLCITGCSKSGQSDGQMTVNLQLDTVKNRAVSGTDDATPAKETISIVLTLQQLYQLLSELEECRLALNAAEK